MKRIHDQIISFGRSRTGFQKTTTLDVAASPGRKIATYAKLVVAVAEIAYRNPRYNLFFRGQAREYKVTHKSSRKRVSSVRPTIFRGSDGKANPSAAERTERFEELQRRTQELRDRWSGRGALNINRYEHLAWALLQHYEVCPTPLLDLTQSLRVAASFASPIRPGRGRRAGTGGFAYVYVFGMPAVDAKITYSVDEDLALVRLQSICPPRARRPHFQEGFLVGDFPLRETAVVGQNLAYRMLAKIRIPETGFWSPIHRGVPWDALMPSEDKVVEQLGSDDVLVADSDEDD